MRELADRPRSCAGRDSGVRVAACALLVLTGVGVAPLSAQETAGVAGPGGAEAELRPVTLEQALATAREGNADLGSAVARERGARARSRAASSFLLPHVELESGFTRSVDPVFAFGTKLRQERFQEEDFSLDALNDPAALDAWTNTARVEWGIASPRAWAARDAAGNRAEAARWQTERSREATDFRTKVLYFLAVGADAGLQAATASEDAARATVDRFRRRADEGLLTEADLLQAEAELAAAKVDRSAAELERHDARLQLGLHLGWSPDTLPVPTDSLKTSSPPAPRRAATVGRADLRAREAAVEAAEARRQEAGLGYLPDLAAFAGYSVHGRDPFADDGTDWSVGVALRWTLFAGLRRPAEAEASSAALEGARLEYQQAVREARGELQQARRAVETAREGLEASRSAREAALAGRDLVRRRFEEGLATPSDLLQAEARAARMRSRAVEALAEYNIALARLAFVRAGSDREASR